MKRIPAIGLLIILTANAAGFYVYYVIALQRIHVEMRAKLRTLPDHQLTRLALTFDAYKRSLVEDDEIRFEGKMYDVARLLVKGDSLIVYAMHDEKEENFLAFANEIICKPFKCEPDIASSVIAFIQLVFLPGQHVDPIPIHGIQIDHWSGFHAVIKPRVLSVEHEPPEGIHAKIS